MKRFHFTAFCRDELGQTGENAGGVILPGGCVKAFIIIDGDHFRTSFRSVIPVQQLKQNLGAFIQGFAEGIGGGFEVSGVFVGQGGIDSVEGKGFKLGAGDGAGLGQLGKFGEGIGGGLGLMKGEGIQHFGLDFRVANRFDMFIREGRYDNCAVGNGVGNDAGGTKIRDGFQNGEVAVAGCGFIVDRERGGFGVGEVVDRTDTQVNIVRGVLFDCVDAGVQNVHCGVGKAFEAFSRLGFIFQPGAGSNAGFTGGRTGIEIANDGGQVKGIGEGESVKRVNHFWDFLSFHNSIFNSACLGF